MAFSVNGLASYVDQNRTELLTASILPAKLAKLIRTIPGVKGTTTLNTLANSVTFQDGSSCGWNASGTTTLSQRSIVPGVVKVQMNFCHKSVLGKYLEHDVRLRAGLESMDFETKITDDITRNIVRELEKALFQGDTTSGTGNNAFFNGLETIISADVTSGVIANSQVSTASQNDTIKDRTYAVYSTIKEENLATSVILMSVANYRSLCLALFNANLYNYKPEVDGSLELTLPGTETKVYAMPGMTGSNKIYAINPDEVFYGFDESGDEEAFDFWFSKDAQEFRLNVNFVAGIQYAFPGNIVVGSPYSA